MSNSDLQADEITALASIYGNDMSGFDASQGSFSVAIRDSSNSPNLCLVLRIVMPPQYPSDCPPVFELNAPWLRGEARRDLEAVLIEVCRDNVGCSIVYAWVEAARHFLDTMAPAPLVEPADVSATIFMGEGNVKADSPSVEASNAKFLHGEPIEDRRSVFQAHLAPVDSVEAAKLSLACLLASEKKVASATHNIWAYRIERPTVSRAGTPAASASVFYTDCDDDGESQAGGRLLRLLELVEARNILIVVSRWYGGVLLGPDRFKHINNAARQLLDAHGFIGAGAKRIR